MNAGIVPLFITEANKLNCFLAVDVLEALLQINGEPIVLIHGVHILFYKEIQAANIVNDFFKLFKANQKVTMNLDTQEFFHSFHSQLKATVGIRVVNFIPTVARNMHASIAGNVKQIRNLSVFVKHQHKKSITSAIGTIALTEVLTHYENILTRR